MALVDHQILHGVLSLIFYSIDNHLTAENPCDSADCDSSTLCLLSPNAEGFSCLCTDDDADCKRMYI